MYLVSSLQHLLTNSWGQVMPYERTTFVGKLFLAAENFW